MFHKCSQCEYSSNLIYNLRRHCDRKHTAKNVDIAQKEIPVAGKEIPVAGKEIPTAGKEIPVAGKEIPNEQKDKNKCEKCEKIFTRKYNLMNHYKNCKGKVNKLECNYCNEIFTSSTNKYRHQKLCKIKYEINKNEKLIQNIQTQINNNIGTQNNTNTNSNNTNNINNTIIINSFGQENTSYITDEFRNQCCTYGGMYAILAMVDQIYFNPDHPENHNMRLYRIREKLLEILDHNKWIPRPKDAIIKSMINNTTNEIVLNKETGEFRTEDINVLDSIMNMKRSDEKIVNNTIYSKILERKQSENNIEI